MEGGHAGGSLEARGPSNHSQKCVVFPFLINHLVPFSQMVFAFWILDQTGDLRLVVLEVIGYFFRFGLKIRSVSVHGPGPFG